VKLDALDAADAERAESPLVLQAAELALDGGASAVQVAEPLGVARDQRMQPGRLDPDGCRFALAGRAAPLRELPLRVGSGECPLAVLAGRRLVLAALDGGGRLQRNDGQASGVVAGVVDGLRVVALVDPAAFAVDAARFAWSRLEADASAIAQMRRERFRSFGSCSFGEPVDELRALAIL
jgi:hypothetical protein